MSDLNGKRETKREVGSLPIESLRTSRRLSSESEWRSCLSESVLGVIFLSGTGPPADAAIIPFTFMLSRPAVRPSMSLSLSSSYWRSRFSVSVFSSLPSFSKASNTSFPVSSANISSPPTAFVVVASPSSALLIDPGRYISVGKLCEMNVAENKAFQKSRSAEYKNRHEQDMIRLSELPESNIKVQNSPNPKFWAQNARGLALKKNATDPEKCPGKGGNWWLSTDLFRCRFKLLGSLR